MLCHFFSVAGLLSGGTSINVQMDAWGHFNSHLWWTVWVKKRLLHVCPVPQWLNHSSGQKCICKCQYFYVHTVVVVSFVHPNLYSSHTFNELIDSIFLGFILEWNTAAINANNINLNGIKKKKKNREHLSRTVAVGGVISSTSGWGKKRRSVKCHTHTHTHL